MESKDLEHPGALTFGEFTLDPQRRGCFRGADRVHLTPKAFDTLLFLASNPGRTVSKKELLKEVWGGVRDESTVEHVVRQIRLALGEEKDHPRFLKTIPWQGYLFLSEVVVSPGLTGAPPMVGEGGDSRQSFLTLMPVLSTVPIGDASRPAFLDNRMTTGEGDSPKRRLSRRRLLAVGGCTMIAAAGLGAYRFLNPVRQPRRAEVADDLLTVADGLGRILWTYRFPRRVHQDGRGPWNPRVIDLEGSGRPGVLVACNFMAGGGVEDYGEGELQYFDADGKQKWSVPCAQGLRDFNGKEIEPSWNYVDMVTTPAGSGYTIWAAVRHGWRWPGYLLRVDAQGRARIQFANAGHIQRLCYLRSSESIAFGGVHNGFDQTCAGIISIGDMPTCSPPSERPGYRFLNGPSDIVRSYVLFPNTETMKARNAPYGHVTALSVHDQGIVVHVDELGGELIYELSDTFDPQVVMPSGSIPLIHQQLEELGKLRHTWQNCPELKRPLILRRFDRSTGWRDQSIPWRLPTDHI